MSRQVRESARKSVLLWLKLVYLLYVDGETARGVEATRTEIALEMLRFLVLHQHCGSFSEGMKRHERKTVTFLVLELPLTIPAPRTKDLQGSKDKSELDYMHAYLLVLLLGHRERAANKKRAASEG